MGSRPNREESVGFQRQVHSFNLEQMRDCEVSVHATYTSRSQSRTGSHVSHREETRNLQLEIDHLCKKLCRKQRMASPSSSRSESGKIAVTGHDQEPLLMNPFLQEGTLS